MSKTSEMSTMGIADEAYAYVTLGLLCGIYQLILVAFPVLLFLMLYLKSLVAGAVFVALLAATVVPINHKPQFWFLRHGIWKVWHKYFDFSYDLTSVQGKLLKGERYLFWEAPHGVWPIGQLLSGASIPIITGVPFEDQMICGTGANLVFSFPFVRHIMSWMGTHTASRASFTKIFSSGHWGAVVAGGIAEMFLGTEKKEGMYIRKRQNTVKMAIQEGAHIVPSFFFGSSRSFITVGGDAEGKDASWFAKLLSSLSRQLKASIVLFYGRHYLPVPMRVPIKMVTGNIVKVTQNDAPSEAEVQRVLDEVMQEFERVYASDMKPAWETRPLVMT